MSNELLTGKDVQIIAMRENAQRQLAEIKTLDEGVSYLGKTKALEAYAKATKQDAEIVIMVQEQKLRSMRILGGLLKETEFENGGNHAGNNQYQKKEVEVQRSDRNQKPRLADLGISKNESSTYQKLADIPDDVFEETIQAAKDEESTTKELTTAGMMRVSQHVRRQEILKGLSRHGLDVGPKKYRVIYADPPWKYGNDFTKAMAGSTRPEDHYMVMDLEEICAMPVRDLCEENAVLFLWGTSPLLPEALDVIHAWGFQYKTSFVWDKVKHNFGHYNSVRHEFLFVATRGSCTPEVMKLHDSVQVCEKTGHSRKPEVFREIIDEIYPSGNRIELFARMAPDGWDVHGNQINGHE